MEKKPPLPAELWDQIPFPVQAAIWVLVEGYEQRIAALEAEVAELKERLNQNSQNSSRPPSSDLPTVKRRPPQASSGRKPGAQPGHTRHERALVPDEQVKEVVCAVSRASVGAVGQPCRGVILTRCGTKSWKSRCLCPK
jgi:transposase